MVPWPTVLATSTSPPDCLAKPKTWDRPSPVPLPTSLVVKKGSKMRGSTSGGMPEPVSVSETAAKALREPAWPRMRGIGRPAVRRSVSVPSPAMASRALTAMLISAVSNWLRSARM
ncbi:hypothetical protein MET9862_05297 [Methylobacterium symbioticum]|uniref:Uncharacterized protein n=1 Tax=Methylobacterium symbioticum TaxID=2584084 RepID=A0A509ELU8_9HYPH|nr:hypothetical protein MET9862_05297 [Methylobacterium symbioticum]